MSEHSNEQPTKQHTQPGVARTDPEQDDLLREQDRTDRPDGAGDEAGAGAEGDGEQGGADRPQRD